MNLYQLIFTKRIFMFATKEIHEVTAMIYFVILLRTIRFYAVDDKWQKDRIKSCLLLLGYRNIQF